MDILLRFCCILSIYCRYLAHQIHSWSFHERSSLAGKEWWTFQQPRGLYGNKNRKTTSLISLIVLNHSELSLVTADSMTIVEHSYKKTMDFLQHILWKFLKNHTKNPWQLRLMNSSRAVRWRFPPLLMSSPRLSPPKRSPPPGTARDGTESFRFDVNPW